jgi:hypothetical protein
MNQGSGNLRISNIDFAAGSSPEFRIKSNLNFPVVIRPNGTLEVEIIFIPSMPGSFSDSLDISSDDPDKPLVNVVLRGTGVYLAYQDIDGDGITDWIDTLPNNYSNDFNNGRVYGTITNRGDQNLIVLNEHPNGVRIISTYPGGATPATVSFCDGSVTTTLKVGEFILKGCGIEIFEIEIVSGTILTKYGVRSDWRGWTILIFCILMLLYFMKKWIVQEE